MSVSEECPVPGCEQVLTYASLESAVEVAVEHVWDAHPGELDEFLAAAARAGVIDLASALTPRVFTCNWCPETFTARGVMARHQLTIHRDLVS